MDFKNLTFRHDRVTFHSRGRSHQRQHSKSSEPKPDRESGFQLFWTCLHCHATTINRRAHNRMQGRETEDELDYAKMRENTARQLRGEQTIEGLPPSNTMDKGQEP